MKKRVDRALAQCYGPFWRLDENLINKIIGYVDDQSLQILSLTVGDLENLSKKLKCRIDSFAKKNKYRCMQCYHRYEKEWQIQYHRSCRKCKYLSLLTYDFVISNDFFCFHSDVQRLRFLGS